MIRCVFVSVGIVCLKSVFPHFRSPRQRFFGTGQCDLTCDELLAITTYMTNVNDLHDQRERYNQYVFDSRDCVVIP